MEELMEETSAATWQEFPESAKTVAAVKAAPALARSLRAGVMDELMWPEFEEVIRGLGAKEKDEIELHGTHTFPIVRRGRKVVVFHGKQKLRDFDLPPAVKDRVNGLYWLDGDLFVMFNDEDYESKALWMSKPKEIADAKFGMRGVLQDTPLEGGGVTLGKLAIHKGDIPSSDPEQSYVTDGTRFWVEKWEGESRWDDDAALKLHELDPKTGQVGRASWPKQVEAIAERSDGFRMRAVELQVAAPGSEASLFGFKDGLVGFVRRAKDREFELTRIDGVSVKQSFNVEGLVRWPGGDELRALEYSHAWSNDDDDEIKLLDDEGEDAAHYGDDKWPSSALFKLPRVPWLHFCVARDEAGSRALRGITDEIAEALLEAAREDVDEDDDDDDYESEEQIALPVMKQTEAALARLLPALTNTDLRRSVAFVVGRALRAERKLGSLLGEGGGAVGKGPTDDAVKEAFFLGFSEGWFDGFVCGSLADVGAFFRGGEPSVPAQTSIAWENNVEAWPKVLCFLASRASLSEEHRATFRGLAEGLLESGLLGLTLTRAWLTVKKDAAFLQRPKNKDEWLFVDGESRLFLRATEYDDDEPEHKVTALALVGAQGKFKPPTGATIDKEESLTIPDAADFLRSFLAELDARGPAPFEKAAATIASEGGTLKPAEATLILAGLPNLRNSYNHDFLGKELRTALDIKVTEAKAAQEKLNDLERDVFKSLVLEAADVATPAAFWAPASDEGSVAHTLARAAKKVLGNMRQHPDDLLKVVEHELEIDMNARELLTALVDESAPHWKPRENVAWNEIESGGSFFSSSVVEGLARLIPWLALHRPVGDEYRAAIPAAYRRARALLESPDLVFRCGDKFVDDKKKRAALYDSFGGKVVEIQHSKGQKGPARDTGVVMVVDDESYSLEIAFRPAKLTDAKARAELERVLALGDDSDDDDDSGDDYSHVAARAVLFLLSKGCEAIVARIEKTPVPEGRYEGDPRVSAPKVVANVRKNLGFDDDAAALYLQTLALPYPAQKLLCEWNGWTPAHYKKVASALVAKKGLLVEGKRDRAGREIFLPGGWEKFADRHVESWKISMFGQLGGVIAVLEPAHALYDRAYTRVIEGDVPRFEETRKKKAEPEDKKGKGKKK